MIPIQSCNCGRCCNEFFIPSMSEDWHPNYCPYCGVKFVRKDTDGIPDAFRPKPVATLPKET